MRDDAFHSAMQPVREDVVLLPAHGGEGDAFHSAMHLLTDGEMTLFGGGGG
jgi:hypothetical protein